MGIELSTFKSLDVNLGSVQLGTANNEVKKADAFHWLRSFFDFGDARQANYQVLKELASTISQEPKYSGIKEEVKNQIDALRIDRPITAQSIHNLINILDSKLADSLQNETNKILLKISQDEKLLAPPDCLLNANEAQKMNYQKALNKHFEHAAQTNYDFKDQNLAKIKANFDQNLAKNLQILDSHNLSLENKDILSSKLFDQTSGKMMLAKDFAKAAKLLSHIDDSPQNSFNSWQTRISQKQMILSLLIANANGKDQPYTESQYLQMVILTQNVAKELANPETTVGYCPFLSKFASSLTNIVAKDIPFEEIRAGHETYVLDLTLSLLSQDNLSSLKHKLSSPEMLMNIAFLKNKPNEKTQQVLASFTKLEQKVSNLLGQASSYNVLPKLEMSKVGIDFKYLMPEQFAISGDYKVYHKPDGSINFPEKHNEFFSQKIQNDMQDTFQNNMVAFINNEKKEAGLMEGQYVRSVFEGDMSGALKVTLPNGEVLGQNFAESKDKLARFITNNPNAKFSELTDAEKNKCYIIMSLVGQEAQKRYNTPVSAVANNYDGILFSAVQNDPNEKRNYTISMKEDGSLEFNVHFKSHINFFELDERDYMKNSYYESKVSFELKAEEMDRLANKNWDDVSDFHNKPYVNNQIYLAGDGCIKLEEMDAKGNIHLELDSTK